jgi:hypothetical protein
MTTGGHAARQARGSFARRCALAAFAAASLVVGFVTAEATLIGPVVFLVGWLGFWPGLAVFTTSCVLFGLVVLWGTIRLWPGRAPGDAGGLSQGPIRQRIGRLVARSRPLGAVAVAWYCGPFASPPILRALGYQGRALVAWVIVAGLLFGSFWFGVYGGGFRLLVRAFS